MHVGFIFYQFHFTIVKEIFNIRLRTTELEYVENAVFIMLCHCTSTPYAKHC